MTIKEELIDYLYKCFENGEKMYCKGICIDDLIKKAKAFDIIVNKKVRMSLFLDYKDGHKYTYNNMLELENRGEKELTQEELDLLKEVL